MNFVLSWACILGAGLLSSNASIYIAQLYKAVINSNQVYRVIYWENDYGVEHSPAGASLLQN